MLIPECSKPVLGHLHPEVLELMSDITAGLQYLFQTNNRLTLAVSGTGHAGMEAAFVNLIEPGDRVLVLQSGIWGRRAKDVAERCGIYSFNVSMMSRCILCMPVLWDIWVSSWKHEGILMRYSSTEKLCLWQEAEI